MLDQQVVCARGSARTALWCWLTKMLAQALTCAPFVLFAYYACPQILPVLVFQLLLYSLLLATIFTGWMMAGVVTAGDDGVHYSNFGRQRRFIPWSKIEFPKPFPFCIEKPYVIARRGTKEAIKIWPSMTGYQSLKDYFSRHGILLEKRSVQEPEFHSFDEVLEDSLGYGSGR